MLSGPRDTGLLPAVRATTWLGLLCLAVATSLGGWFVGSLPTEVIASSAAIRFIGISALLAVSLVATVYIPARRYGVYSGVVARAIALVLWFFLLIDETVFFRTGSTENALAGSFDPAAYGEVIIWAAAFLILGALAVASRLPLRIFSGHNLWLSLFALFCSASVIYSPRPMFSLAWAFKLCLVVLVVQVWSAAISTHDDIKQFLNITAWGFCAVIVAALIQLLIEPSMAFGYIVPGGMLEPGRLGGMYHPTNVSDAGGMVLLLSAVLYSWDGRKWRILLGVLGAVVLILGGGKTAIVATVVSGVLFFLLRRKVSSAVGLAAGIAIVGFVVAMTTPVGSYLGAYATSGQALTFTGRTDLWRAALPVISESPILGHGYVASRFVSLDVPGVEWEPGHMHNSFLEVLYNGGVLGFGLLLTINVVIVRNLRAAVKRRSTRNGAVLVAGLVASYATLVIDGLFRPAFGGRPDVLFMTFIALYAISDRLCHTGSHGVHPRHSLTVTTETINER